MKTPEKPSSAEKVAGHVGTEAALTVVAALAGGPLAPLLPVLAKSLAATRQQARVEKTLSEIREVLDVHSEQIKNLSDEQYKLINESVLAVLQTTQNEKLIYLRRAIENSLRVSTFKANEATLLSRVIRDISAEEAEFLLFAFEYKGILLTAKDVDSVFYVDVLQINPSSPQGLCATGLQSLGLLAPPETGFNGGTMRFSSIVGKLITLLRSPDA